MRINRLRKGLEVANKVNGKFYKVTSVDENGAIGVTKEMLIDKDGEWSGELGDYGTSITEENSLAFRIVNDPEPYPVPKGYSIEDGKLMKDGVPACEAGELSFIKILAVQNDYLILTAKKKGTQEGMVELMSYQVSRDRFARLHYVPETVMFLGYAGKNGQEAILGYSVTEEKEMERADGSYKTASVFVQSGIVTVTDGTRASYHTLNTPITLENIIIKEVPGGNDRYEAFLPMDWREDDDGFLVKRDHRLWTTMGEDIASFEADGQIQVDWSYAYKSFVIRTKDMIMVPVKDLTIQSTKVAALDGYNTLIDITKADYEYRLTFSNEAYGFKTLVSKSTRDRGYIVTVG